MSKLFDVTDDEQVQCTTNTDYNHEETAMCESAQYDDANSQQQPLGSLERCALYDVMGWSVSSDYEA